MSNSGQLVFLPAAFIEELIKEIEPHRPLSRNTMVIPPGDRWEKVFFSIFEPFWRYAVLQADFTLRKSKQGIAMEIKPKSGVIPSGRQSCRFCVTQLQKIRRGKYDARSAYCPVDLYSPYIKRKARFLTKILKVIFLRILKIFKKSIT